MKQGPAAEAYLKGSNSSTQEQNSWALMGVEPLVAQKQLAMFLHHE